MTPHIFFVDDELPVQRAVTSILEKAGFNVSSFSCAVDCLQQLPCRTCDLLITDVAMPGMNGIELLTEIRQTAPWVPVVIVTGYGDVPMTKAAFKLGVVDFIEKPFARQTLLSAVESALGRVSLPASLRGKPLTRTEMQVLRLILEGKTSRGIARARRRALRTIEDQRTNIMRKLGVNNLVDLVKRAVLLGIVDPQRTG